MDDCNHTGDDGSSTLRRDIPVSNGSLLVDFDQTYRLRGVYRPKRSRENYVENLTSCFGVWAEGAFSWVHDSSWMRSLGYEHDALVTQVTLYNPALSLRIACSDTVDRTKDLYLRKMTVDNLDEDTREVRLVFAHTFNSAGVKIGRSAYYEPKQGAVIHHEADRWYMINAATPTAHGWAVGIDQWEVGKNEPGPWRDAEDSSYPVPPEEQGSTDSTVVLHLTVPGRGQATGWYWMAVGGSLEQVDYIHRLVGQEGVETFLDRTRGYWRQWVNRTPHDLCGLPSPLHHLYRRSLLILRTQIDSHGTMMAADNVSHRRQGTWSCIQPRDSAWVAAALVDAGFPEIARSILASSFRAIADPGPLSAPMHDRSPDTARYDDYAGANRPFSDQSDEMALALWALWRHCQRFQDLAFIRSHYGELVVRTANWLVEHRDPGTGLPLPSWDLWQERWGMHAWTSGAVWAGLQAAAGFAAAFDEQERADAYRRAADEIRAGVERTLWQPGAGRFARAMVWQDGGWRADLTIDASLTGLWYFQVDGTGMFSPRDPRIVATMQAIRDRLWVSPGTGGIMRHEHDHPLGRDIGQTGGGPWFVCTLWLAQWITATAQTLADLEPAQEILEWAANHALPSGVLTEQVYAPNDNSQVLSTSPSAWSHAVLVSAVLQAAERWTTLHKATRPDHERQNEKKESYDDL